VFRVILLSLVIHSCYVGSKVVTSLLALELGANQAVVGILAACYAFFPLVLAVYSGRFADTVGMRLPMIVGVVCTGLAMLIGYLRPTLGILFIVALLMGAAFVLFNVSIQNLAGGIGRPDARAHNFSLLSIGYSVSTFLGPTFAGFSIDRAGYAATYGFFAAVTLIPLCILLYDRRLADVQPASAETEKRSALDLLRNPPLRTLIVTSGLVVAASDLFAFYLPVYGHAIGLSASMIGVILGTYAFAAFVTRFTLPVLLRRFSANRLMFAFMLTAACAFVLLPFTHRVALLMVLAFLVGLGLGCGQPVLMTLAYERSPTGRTGEVTGLRLTANNVARVVIPLLSGTIGAALGAAPVFWLNAANLAAVSYFSRK